MKLDLASAYAASLARVASWAVLAGIVYRNGGQTDFAAFSFIRVAITIASLTGLGLAPALTILLPRFRPISVEREPQDPVARPTFLDYGQPLGTPPLSPDERLLGTALKLLMLAAVVTIGAVVLVMVLSDAAIPRDPFWEIVRAATPLAVLVTLIRVAGDIVGAQPQTDGRLARDNALQACGEVAWVLLALLFMRVHKHDEFLLEIYFTLLASSLLFTMGRWSLARSVVRMRGFDLQYAALLLKTGSVLMFAQIADLLYAPANQAIIKGFLSTGALATYAPLLHIDAALLLGVSGLATLLLPKTAVAMSERNPAAVRRYYVNGTLASFAVLTIGASLAWGFATPLFKLWFNDPLPATVALLPLVMVHTVIGGSAGVGRSILFGLNRAKVYTIAALVGGAANVSLAIVLVMQTSLGVRGIVLATIVTVVARCAVWMPWYVLRVLREESARVTAGRIDSLAATLAEAPPIT